MAIIQRLGTGRFHCTVIAIDDGRVDLIWAKKVFTKLWLTRCGQQTNAKLMDKLK